MKLGILISGRGSNMLSLVQACEADDYPARVAVVVSNLPEAAGLRAASELGIPTACVDHRDHADRASFEAALLRTLRQHDVELVCLAGFMRLLGPAFLHEYRHRVLNIHPSLLPAFPGLNAHEQALEYGVRWSGCTVHLVTAVMDGGPIVLQEAVPVLPGDDAHELSARILQHEHRLYPEAVRLLVSGRLQIRGRRVTILEEASAEPRHAQPAEAEA